MTCTMKMKWNFISLPRWWGVGVGGYFVYNPLLCSQPRIAAPLRLAAKYGSGAIQISSHSNQKPKSFPAPALMSFQFIQNRRKIFGNMTEWLCSSRRLQRYQDRLFTTSSSLRIKLFLPKPRYYIKQIINRFNLSITYNRQVNIKQVYNN